MIYEFYIVFLSNKSKFNILAWLIKFAQKTKYNHVEILVIPKPKLGAGVSYGAVFPCSRKIVYGDLFKKYDLVQLKKIDINIDQYEALRILNNEINKPYSFLQLIIILIKVSFHALSVLASKVKLNLDKYLICTELVGIFLRDAAGADFLSVETLTLKDLDKDWTINK